ncbi:hypothetical protein J7337_010424 [Fusarium musae]|uniref:Uncharacterized protein n=1 Tax=Fusarium musae TaxID=1042133 RepID=A0A9P8D941_9HYPO|nr:hypothetical protein J7337_010424 [Fusarium musae]KAG9497563.1 hypothetical protein J7337_010424 [Fusarium musae]
MPYRTSPIGGKIPVTVNLDAVNNGFRADYLTYFIIQRRKRRTKSRATGEADEQKLVLLERFTAGRSTATRRNTDEEERTSPCDSDASLESLFGENYLPSPDPGVSVSISDDLMLPTFRVRKD